MNGIKLELTGQRFGRLIVVGKSSIRKRKNIVWVCKCDCGNTVEATGTSLQRGTPKSCGCWQREEQSKRAKKRPYESLYNTSILKGAWKYSEIPMTYDDFLEFTKETECHYCGDPVRWEPYRTKTYKYNLDRKNSTIGYTKENCVVCCWFCNRMKYIHTYQEFIDKAVKIAVRRGK